MCRTKFLAAIFLLKLSLLSLTANAHTTPTNCLIKQEWIKADHLEVEKLIKQTKGNGNQLREAIQKLIEQEKALVLETTLIVCRPGEIGHISSIKERPVPTDFSSISNIVALWNHLKTNKGLLQAFAFQPTHFEFRDEGTISEIELNIEQGALQRVISIDLQVEFWSNLKKTNAVMPDFQIKPAAIKSSNSLIQDQSIIANNNHYTLISSNTYKTSSGLEDPRHSVFMFIFPTIKVVY